MHYIIVKFTHLKFKSILVHSEKYEGLLTANPRKVFSLLKMSWTWVSILWIKKGSVKTICQQQNISESQNSSWK